MSQQLSAFRSRIQELELELQEFKSGRKVVSEDGSVVINDMAYEITMLRTENDKCVCFAAKFRITAYIPDWVVVLSFCSPDPCQSPSLLYSCEFCSY